VSDQNYPKGWGDYISTLTPEEKESSDEWKKLGAWAARFRAARSLSNITLDGMSENATAGYYVGLKLTLIETALETFERVFSLKPGSVWINDPDISYELWEERTNELVSALDKLENKEIRKGLQQFLDADKDSCQKFDLRLFLKAFRHLTAHGFFNPSSSGLYTSPKYRRCLLALGDKALETCEKWFQAEFQIDEPPEEIWVEVELSEGDQDRLVPWLAERNKKQAEVLKSERLKRDEEQASDNVSGHALFLSRTQGLSLEIVHAQETDSGDVLRSEDAVIAQAGLGRNVYSALMVPAEFNYDYERGPISYKDDPEVIAEVLAQSTLYITARDGWSEKSLAEDLSTMGLQLEWASRSVGKLLTGWFSHMMPVLGVPVATVVVNRAVVDYPHILSVAGSTHHYMKIEPDVLVELTKATII
jgi:hypothetical protein